MNKKKRGRPSKRETPSAARSSSYALSPQHKFGLALLAKQLGTDKTVALQSGIELALADLKLSRAWLSLYSDDEIVTKLNLYSMTEYLVSEEERQERQFILAHSRFFYLDADRLQPNAVFARILLPKLAYYAKHWRDNLHTDYHCAAKLMVADIKAAGKKPPAIGE